MLILKKTQSLLFIFLFFNCFLKAQTEIRVFDTTNNVYSDYILVLTDSLSIQTSISSKYNKFEISTKPDDESEVRALKYHPNEKTSLGFGFNYKWLGFSFGLSLPFLNRDEDKFGKTEQFDFQTNIYLRKFVIDAYVQGYKGYYVENPKDIDPNWTEEKAYPHRDDISTAAAGFSFCVVKNYQKFSYKSVFTQTEVQKKSAGSWLYGGFFSAFVLNADSSIIGFSNYYDFNDTSKIENAVIINGGASFGYAHTFILKKKYYLSFTFLPGIAFQKSSIKAEGISDIIYKKGPNARIQGRVAAGYFGLKNYWGLSVVTDNFIFDNSTTTQLKYTLGNVKFFFGHWFNAEKIKQKIF
ncbi:MAG: hypothetical protein A2275_05500 [Bacteroidetes bacterium RIFOXYA12_FULL_35_11]|nr:MAG: hypothetical protein A2X01_19535 [Bacteroidetes bacterium GWF2_35_48]OFY75115.1 MAG: hypothetical protein A2275_05500 [Bacteroidetes bacterium RIFOXYA12_FULL_35_11]OFY96503.1 MAG: hypothetical protein A2491_14850 [Bacteroidetes bacterium RIFOXYC12_FULL_35_7]HBX50940.1 hypothetical protein [Bacteroidales bacterium]